MTKDEFKSLEVGNTVELDNNQFEIIFQGHYPVVQGVPAIWIRRDLVSLHITVNDSQVRSLKLVHKGDNNDP